MHPDVSYVVGDERINWGTINPACFVIDMERYGLVFMA